MLRMATFQVCNPVLHFVLMIPDNPSLHHFSSRAYGQCVGSQRFLAPAVLRSTLAECIPYHHGYVLIDREPNHTGPTTTPWGGAQAERAGAACGSTGAAWVLCQALPTPIQPCLCGVVLIGALEMVAARCARLRTATARVMIKQARWVTTSV
jgi:hypothetical protein